VTELRSLHDGSHGCGIPGSHMHRVDPPAPRVVYVERTLNAHALGHLSGRQREVAHLLCSPLTVPEIAHRIGLAASTVEHHQGRIYETFGIEAGTRSVARIELYRILTGADPCPIG
jgi:DNA-binding NarL/FixJ family response regulator